MFYLHFSWNNLISSSPATMKKLGNLVLKTHFDGSCHTTTHWVDKFDDLIEFKRHYHTLKVTLIDHADGDAAKLFLELIKRIGFSIKKLILRDGSFSSLDEFRGILQQVPSVETLKLHNLSVDEEINSFESVSLENLLTLEMNECDLVLLQCVTADQINSLSVNSLNSDSIQRETFIDFLKSSGKLQSLNINVDVYVDLFQSELNVVFPFRLKKFRISSSGLFTLFNLEVSLEELDINYGSFLRSQASSLEELDLYFSRGEIVEIIFMQLKALKKLTIIPSAFPSEKAFYEQLKPSESLKDIRILRDFPGIAGVEGFFGNCPNLEILIVDISDHSQFIFSMIPFVNNFNPKLKALTVRPQFVQQLSAAKFVSLTSFHVEYIHQKDFDIFIRFVKNNPTIEILSMWTLGKNILNLQTLEVLISHPKLRILKFCGNVEAVKSMCDEINNNNGFLGELKLKEEKAIEGRSSKTPNSWQLQLPLASEN